MKVEPPDIEAGLAEGVPPGITVEPVRDRERRGKSGAVDVEDRPYLAGLPTERRQIAQE
jgi:hypothetical protein